MRRTRDKSREQAFAANLAGWDWSGLGGDVNAMATGLTEVVGTLTKKQFQLARVRKLNKSPWITGRKCVGEKSEFTGKEDDLMPGGTLTD